MVAEHASQREPIPWSRLRRLWGRLSSVRARATLVGVLVVGVALAAGALGLLSVLRSSMTEGVETTAQAQLNDVASLLRLGQLPAELPSGRGDTFTQVVAADGSVVATSANLLASTPMSRVLTGEEGVVVPSLRTLVVAALRRGQDYDGPYLILSQTVPGTTWRQRRRTGHGVSWPPPCTQWTRRPPPSAEPWRRAARSWWSWSAALIWIFGGRALRPVEAIRAEVADISGHDLHRRVPEPETQRRGSPAGPDHEPDARPTRSHRQRRNAVSWPTRPTNFAAPSPLFRRLWRWRMPIRATARPGRAVPDALDETRRLQRLVDDLLALASIDETGGNPIARRRWTSTR